jgi:guanylate kinase
MGNTTNGESYERISMKIFVITAPSGAGKDSIVNELKEKYHVPTSFTTRPKRVYEVDGKDYHFITKEEFYFKFNNNEILEHREYNTLLNGKPDTWYYGLSKDSLSDDINVIIVDLQGLRQLKEIFDEDILTSIYIYVDDNERKNRAMKRGSFCEVEWNRRLEDDNRLYTSFVINTEIDYVVENNNLDNTVKEILEIIESEL